MTPRASKSAITLAAILTIPLAGACGSEAGSQTAEAAPAAADQAPAQGGPGTGVLVLGDESYPLRVSGCDLTGDFDTADGDGTLAALGTLDDGTRFVVRASREQIPRRHEVSASAFSARDRFMWSAERERSGAGWGDDGGAGSTPDEPLIHIDGDRVTAEGMFRDVRRIGEAELRAPVPGRLEATCR